MPLYNLHNVSYVALIESMGDDLRIVNAARVSFNKQSTELGARDEKLINYLAKHDHWTPMGHVVATIHIVTPIFVARQWMKSEVGVHRGIEVINEVSRRYVDEPPEYFIPKALHKRPDASIKQGSGDEHPRSNQYLYDIDEHYQRCHDLYMTMIDDGVAPEEARMVLPLAHMTEFWETGTLAYFARVCRLRLGPHVQRATRELAEKVSEVISPVAPHAWKAMMEAPL